MKKIFDIYGSVACTLLLIITLLPMAGGSQSVERILKKTIKQKEVTRIASTLSSDAMEGRETFTPGIEKAAAFIAEEFKRAGLPGAGDNGGYLQNITMLAATLKSGSAELDGNRIPADSIFCISTNAGVELSQGDGTTLGTIAKGENFIQSYRKWRSQKGDVVVLVDTSHRKIFGQLQSQRSPRFKSDENKVFLLTPQTAASNFSVALNQEVKEMKLANVVATLPGKSKPNEYVIFSGHYDHIGYGKPNEKGDSLYNGANDDASGTTAVIMLAKYFKKLSNNERTLIFAAFTAEEVGGFGSQHFSKQYEPAKVAAMFNIEMIGTESKWGKNSAYITGYEKTDMGQILEQNLAGTAFKFYPDPYPDQQLFYRSDNATLARLGVPAHTISTSKMDNEPHYHKPSDEMSTLDMKNMTEVIKSIALSSRSIVAGKQSPSRVDAGSLQR
jgi:hypothetical protein